MVYIIREKSAELEQAVLMELHMYNVHVIYVFLEVSFITRYTKKKGANKQTITS